MPTNVFDILALILPSKKDRASSIIENKIGNMLYFYYKFVEKMGVRPTTIEDLVDGILYIGVETELKKLYQEK